MNIKLGILSLGLLVGLSGCMASTAPKVEPIKIKNEIMEITLKPSNHGWCAPTTNYQGFGWGNDFRGYSFMLRNLTDKAIEIDWNKSKYTYQGISISGLAPRGMKMKDLGGNKQSSLIFPNDIFSMTLTPDNLVFWSGKVWSYTCLNNPLALEVIKRKAYGINLVYKIDGVEKYMRVKAEK